jgi:CspA family cold shock protein
MSTGRILQYDVERRFGFILLDGGGKDVFFHDSSVMSDVELTKGQRVSFEITTDDRNGKLRADKVRVL